MDNKNTQTYGRISLNNAINGFFTESSDKSDTAKKAIRISYVMSLYRQAIESIYKDSAFLVLEKTNAVYIFKEKDKGIRRKARPGDKTINRMVVYTCDSTVHADLDSRQEYLKVWMETHGEKIDKLDLLTSKLGMRKKFPYANAVKELKKQYQPSAVISEDFYCNSDTTLNKKDNLHPDNLYCPKNKLNEEEKIKLKDKLKNINDKNLQESLRNLIDSKTV